MLIGFEEIKKNLAKDQSQNQLHHAILLSGKKGIGKASFAREFALEVLGAIGAQNKNHPDLFLIEKIEGKKNISIDQIRKISGFLNQTSAMSKNRFIIIDAADELNRSSSNALLKILEEPSQNCFLILISHCISRILPTIRSRCKIVKIHDLDFAQFEKAMIAARPDILPKICDDEMKVLAKICDNSPAKATKYGDDLIFLYQSFLSCLKNNMIDGDLSKKINDKKFNFDNFVEVIDFFFLRIAYFYSGQIDYFLFDEKDVFGEVKTRFSFEEIFKIHQFAKNQLKRTRSVNLNKKLTLLNIFNSISG